MSTDANSPNPQAIDESEISSIPAGVSNPASLENVGIRILQLTYSAQLYLLAKSVN